MLCNLAIRRLARPDENGCVFVLRIAGKHTLGSAGQSSSDERAFTDESAMIATLEVLKVEAEEIAEAAACMRSDAHTGRFVPIGASTQIPFAALEEQGFDLYD